MTTTSISELTSTPIAQSYPGKAPGEFQNTTAFAVLRADGSVVAWGASSYCDDSSSVASKLDGTIDVVSMANPFANDVYLASGSSTSGGSTTTTTLTLSVPGRQATVRSKVPKAGTVLPVQVAATSDRQVFAELR